MNSRLASAVAVGFAAFAISACDRSAPPPRQVLDHVVLLVFDQMRPDYIDRFGLEHFKRLRATSRNYPDAYVGHLSSQTVVAHLVIPTGLRPGALPWQDDVLVDVEGALGTPGAAYDTGDLKPADMWRLLEKIPKDQFLATRIRETLGGQVFAVGEKDYAATILGGPYANAIVTLTKAEGRCTPAGINVPEYIAANQRFAVECKETYGTDFSTIYKLDGSHYVPGKDAARLGGDVWTADAAIEIMKRESWSGLFLTFGGIDKVAHMLGGHDGPGLLSVPSQYDLASVLKTADAQLGRILSALDEQKLAARTLVVVTADHGGQRNEFYLGNGRYQSCCALEGQSPTAKVEPPYWLEHLSLLGRLRTAYADTSLTVWLADRSAENEQAITRGLSDVSGITEIYALRRTGGAFRYEQVLSRLETQSASFRSWAERHSADLLASLAGPSAPDLVGLLGDGFGFGRIGGHGGAQERVQRIPMIVHVPGEAPTTRTTPLRLMDLAAEITELVGLRPAPAGRSPR